jgi:hypothetical protein
MNGINNLFPQRDGYRFEQDITVQLSQTEDAKEARQAISSQDSETVQVFQNGLHPAYIYDAF